MIALEDILNEKEEGSSLSAEASFTLQDLLLEPDDLIEEFEETIDPDDFEEMFDDDSDEEEENVEKSERAQEVASQVESTPKEQIEQPKVVQKEEKKVVFRERRLKDMPMPDLQSIKNMSFVVIKNVTALFETPEARGVGIPTVIAVKSERYLALGTSLGNVALFEMGTPGHKLLGTRQHLRYGQVTAIAISPNGRYLVVGQDNGMVTTWSIESATQMKRELCNSSRIIKIIFCSNNEFITNDVQGYTRLYTIENFLWTNNIRSERLFNRVESPFHDVRGHTLKTAGQVIGFCAFDYVLIMEWKQAKMSPVARITRPQQKFQSSKFPNIEFGSCLGDKDQSYDVLCVSWGRTVFVYSLLKDNLSGQLRAVLSYSFETGSTVFNMEFVAEGVLMALDSLQTFRTFRVQASNGGKLLQNRELTEEVVYCRNMRDRTEKPIHSFGNTIVGCPQGRQKDLFFICRRSIYRCRMHKWNQVIADMIETDKDYKKALKICLQISKGTLDIFVEPVERSDKTHSLLCQVGNRFIVNELKSIEKTNMDRVSNFDQLHSIREIEGELQEAYDCLIEYMIKVKATDYLLQSLYSEIFVKSYRSEEYEHKFLDCTGMFMRAGLIRRLPNRQFFQKVIRYFLDKGHKDLVEVGLMSLDPKAIFYDEAIMICTSNHLYRALAYVSSTHQDYISPLTKLLQAMHFAHEKRHNQALEQYYTIFKDCLVQLIAGCYVNGAPIEGSSTAMYLIVSTWLACQETYDFFARIGPYQHDYFSFLESLLSTMTGSQEMNDHIHSILGQLRRDDRTKIEITKLLIKLSQSIKLHPQEVQWIISNSTAELIAANLGQYLHLLHSNQSLIESDSSKSTQVLKFVSSNPQLYYFYSVLKKAKLPIPQQELKGNNKELSQYMLGHLSSQQIGQMLEDLLKLNSQNTMVYMLERFPYQKVDQRLLSITDPYYRYATVSKLLKKIRRDKADQGDSKRISPLHLSLGDQSEKDSTSEHSKSSASIHIQPSRRKLGPQVMEFYMECLCKFKKEKRVYYEFVCYMLDYQDNIDRLVRLITPFKMESCLGWLEERRGNLEVAMKHYQVVYRQYFFEENYYKLVKIVHCHGRFMRRIFDRMLFITHTLDKDTHWLQLLNCVIAPLEETPKNRDVVCSTIQDVYEKKSSHPFLLQLGDILEVCLENVSRKVPIAEISTFIGDHSSLFSKTFFLNSLRSALMTYSRNANIFKIVNKMVKEDQVLKFEEIQALKIKGIVPEALCEHCSLPIGQKRSQIYKCGHTYHVTCVNRYRKLSYDGASSNGVEYSQYCRRCKIDRTGGDYASQQSAVPDFNLYQEGVLMRGVKGIANFIPNMVSAMQRQQVESSSELEQLRQSQLMAEPTEDEFNDYLALQANLQQRESSFDHFMGQYQRYLDRY